MQIKINLIHHLKVYQIGKEPKIIKTMRKHALSYTLLMGLQIGIPLWKSIHQYPTKLQST